MAHAAPRPSAQHRPDHPRHAGSGQGVVPATPSLLGSRHGGARDESVPVERRLRAFGCRRYVSAIGGLQLAGPSPARSEKGAAVKRSVIVVALAMGMVLVGFGSGRPAQAATSTKTVRYGPFTIPAGTATDPG